MDDIPLANFLGVVNIRYFSDDKVFQIIKDGCYETMQDAVEAENEKCREIEENKEKAKKKKEVNVERKRAVKRKHENDEGLINHWRAKCPRVDEVFRRWPPVDNKPRKYEEMKRIIDGSDTTDELSTVTKRTKSKTVDEKKKKKGYDLITELGEWDPTDVENLPWCYARYQGGKHWYGGKVVHENKKDNTFDVVYDAPTAITDGSDTYFRDLELNVPLHRLHFVISKR